MIDRVHFAAEIGNLSAAFDKNLKSATVEEYYKAFETLTDEQWTRLCTWAKDCLEIWPRISIMKNQAANFGFWGRKMSGIMFTTLDCDCGYSFSIATDSINAQSYYDCAGKAHGFCNKTFGGGWLLDRNRAPIGSVYVKTEMNRNS